MRPLGPDAAATIGGASVAAATTRAAQSTRSSTNCAADPAFTGATIGKVLAFATPSGNVALPASLVTSLGELLAKAKPAPGGY